MASLLRMQMKNYNLVDMERIQQAANILNVIKSLNAPTPIVFSGYMFAMENGTVHWEMMKKTDVTTIYFVWECINANTQTKPAFIWEVFVTKLKIVPAMMMNLCVHLKM